MIIIKIAASIIFDSLHFCVVVITLSLPSVFIEFHNEVSDHANTEEDDDADDLGEGTDVEGPGDEGNDESKGLPHSVVGEGGFFIISKQSSIQCIDLKQWIIMAYT